MVGSRFPSADRLPGVPGSVEGRQQSIDRKRRLRGAAAEFHQANIHDDAMQPGPESRVSFECSDRLNGREKTLLDRVFAVGVGSQKSPGGRQCWGAKPSHKLFARVRFPPFQRGRQSSGHRDKVGKDSPSQCSSGRRTFRSSSSRKSVATKAEHDSTTTPCRSRFCNSSIPAASTNVSAERSSRGRGVSDCAKTGRELPATRAPVICPLTPQSFPRPA